MASGANPPMMPGCLTKPKATPNMGSQKPREPLGPPMPQCLIATVCMVRAGTLENDPEAGELPSHQAGAEDLLLRECGHRVGVDETRAGHVVEDTRVDARQTPGAADAAVCDRTVPPQLQDIGRYPLLVPECEREQAAWPGPDTRAGLGSRRTGRISGRDEPRLLIHGKSDEHIDTARVPYLCLVEILKRDPLSKARLAVGMPDLHFRPGVRRPQRRSFKRPNYKLLPRAVEPEVLKSAQHGVRFPVRLACDPGA